MSGTLLSGQCLPFHCSLNNDDDDDGGEVTSVSGPTVLLLLFIWPRVISVLQVSIVFARHQTQENQPEQGWTYLNLSNKILLFSFLIFAKCFATVCTNEYNSGW